MRSHQSPKTEFISSEIKKYREVQYIFRRLRSSRKGNLQEFG
jgi:hypothetical protein